MTFDIEISDMLIDMTLSDFDAIAPIEIPEAALNAPSSKKNLTTDTLAYEFIKWRHMAPIFYVHVSAARDVLAHPWQPFLF